MDLARRILRAMGVPPGSVRRLPRNLRTEVVLQRKALRERALLRRARAEDRLQAPPSGAPLISVTIPTFNRGELLAARTLPSVLAQTHAPIEVVVVGDHCTDSTPSRIAEIGDPRIRFVNRPERGRYPEDPVSRWMVAGTPAVNQALIWRPAAGSPTWMTTTSCCRTT